MIKDNFQRYDAYKDSGVEWIDEIPERWSMKRLNDISFVIDPQPDHRAPALAEGDGYPYIGIRDLNEDGSLNFDTARKVEISAVEKQECSFKVVSGDILFCKVGTLGEPRIIVPKGRFALSATLVLIKVKNNESNIFLRYALDSSCVFDQINHFGSGSTRPALGIKQIRKFFFPFPSLTEQKAIAAYLDTRTALIDHKIDLLTKKVTQYGKLKQSLINESVTRGLDKPVSMKDSGVVWIGEVPEHWDVRRAKDLFDKKARPCFDDDKIVTAFRDGQVTLRLNRRVAGFTNAIKEHGYQQIKTGDLVIHAMDAFAGAIGVSDSTGKSSPVYSAYTAHDKETVYIPYYGKLLRQMALSGFISSLGKGIRERSTEFRHKEFMPLELVVPPLQEQITIADYLDTKTKQIDCIIETINMQIYKLKELRKTLINDVVTGKIKVV